MGRLDRLPQRDVGVGRDPEARVRCVSPYPQHRAFPARQSCTVSIRTSICSPVERFLLLDQWAVQQAYDVQQAVVAAYERYDFPEIVQRVQNFCTNEMGALYLDITKDRLYTMHDR